MGVGLVFEGSLNFDWEVVQKRVALELELVIVTANPGSVDGHCKRSMSQ